MTAANLRDAVGAKVVLTKLDALTTSRLHKLWADQAYQGELVSWLHNQFRIQLEIVKAAPTQLGFVVQPRRWVVERTFSWFGHFRRLSRDYETCPFSSEAMIYLASIAILLNRLTT